MTLGSKSSSHEFLLLYLGSTAEGLKRVSCLTTQHDLLLAIESVKYIFQIAVDARLKAMPANGIRKPDGFS